MPNKLDGYKKNVDSLPLIKHYLEELGVYDLFKKYVEKGRSQEEPAEGLCLLIMNILSSGKPLYKVSQWLQEYLDELDEIEKEPLAFNDDRFARNLDKLYQADRGSLMAELSAKAIKTHELETKIIHNDTTTITFQGEYHALEELEAVQLKRGYNKDGHPDCKQIVFGLNITEDGHVPISYKAYDGNTSDNHTHLTNWDSLRKIIKEEKFIYVADSKLCSMETLDSLNSKGGLFITVLPKNRQEVKAFYEKIRQTDIIWKHTMELPNSRKRSDTITYLTKNGEKTREGYSILWVRSSAKALTDEKKRQKKVEAGEKSLKQIAGKLNSYHLKTFDSIQLAVEKALSNTRDYFNYQIIEEIQPVKKQKQRGRPGRTTQYQQQTQVTYRLAYQLNQKALKQASLSDGIFPIVHNTTNLTDKEVLETYKKQPYLEKRHEALKSVNQIAPVYLKKNTRIEAMLFRNEVALMVLSLMERNIRLSMIEQDIEKLPILPQGMNTKTPTWSNIKYLFHPVYAFVITKGKTILKISIKGLTDLHKQVLGLLKVPWEVYELVNKHWWRFIKMSPEIF